MAKASGAYKTSEKHRARSKAYRESHKDMCAAYRKKYYLLHKEEIIKQHKDRRHRIGECRPMEENKECPHFLGIHIAENILQNLFSDIKRMPVTNKGYDLLCKQGFKIDVKSSCRHHRGGTVDAWSFVINYNQIADYFLCLAFDNRDSLKPEHLWLIPGKDVSHLHTVLISDRAISLSKWEDYEKPLDEVDKHCKRMRIAIKRRESTKNTKLGARKGVLARRIVACACGCGETFETPTRGHVHPKKFVSGHNARVKNPNPKTQCLPPGCEKVWSERTGGA